MVANVERQTFENDALVAFDQVEPLADTIKTFAKAVIQRVGAFALEIIP